MTLGLSLFVLSACAHKPIAEQYRNEAEAQNLTFSMIYQNPDAYVGGFVLWGGIIVQTTVVKGGTQIIVAETPIGEGERPENVQNSQGRFIAMSSQFLDPTIYKAGREITLAGQVAGKKTLPLGETTYTYPVVTVKQIHLWQPRPRYVYPYVYPYGYPYGYPYVYPYYYWGWGPYWYWGPRFYGGYHRGYYGHFHGHGGQGRESGRH